MFRRLLAANLILLLGTARASKPMDAKTGDQIRSSAPSRNQRSPVVISKDDIVKSQFIDLSEDQTWLKFCKITKVGSDGTVINSLRPKDEDRVNNFFSSLPKRRHSFPSDENPLACPSAAPKTSDDGFAIITGGRSSWLAIGNSQDTSQSTSDSSKDIAVIEDSSSSDSPLGHGCENPICHEY